VSSRSTSAVRTSAVQKMIEGRGRNSAGSPGRTVITARHGRPACRHAAAKPRWRVAAGERGMGWGAARDRTAAPPPHRSCRSGHSKTMTPRRAASRPCRCTRGAPPCRGEPTYLRRGPRSVGLAATRSWSARRSALRPFACGCAFVDATRAALAIDTPRLYERKDGIRTHAITDERDEPVWGRTQGESQFLGSSRAPHREASRL